MKQFARKIPESVIKLLEFLKVAHSDFSTEKPNSTIYIYGVSWCGKILIY